MWKTQQKSIKDWKKNNPNSKADIQEKEKNSIVDISTTSKDILETKRRECEEEAYFSANTNFLPNKQKTEKSNHFPHSSH